MGVSVTGPVQVDLLPSEFSSQNFADKAAAANLCVSVLTLIVTALIPVLIWWLGTSLQKQERLQGHVSKLSDTEAMHVIGQFKEACQSINRNYAHVYRDRQQVTAQASGGGTVTITQEQLQQVSVARSRLQGIWDNIMDDFRAGLLGEPITHPRQGRMLRRGLTYMELVEPLEAANYAYLQRCNPRLKDPYVVPSAARTAATAAAAAPPPPSPPLPPPAAAAGPLGAAAGPVAGDAAISVQMAPATSGTTAPSTNTLLDKAPKFCTGGRPSRFKWLENQKTAQVLSAAAPTLGSRLLRRLLLLLRLQQPPQQLWSAKAVTATLPSGQTVRVFEVQAGAAAQLTAGGREANQWAAALQRHWDAVLRAYSGP